MANEEWQKIGRASDYFSKSGAAAIELTKGLFKMGDVVKLRGHTTNFEQVISSMQIDNISVQEANVGDSVGIKVDERARKYDLVYKRK